MSPTLEQRLRVREKPPLSPFFFQDWNELLFLHWVFDPTVLQAKLPKGLTIDTYDEKAYVGIIPFFMDNIKPALFGRTFPGINFYEMNVRTYVYDEEGTPGVWFFSLDASNWFAEKAGRHLFHLPYVYSQFEVNRQENSIDYQCIRSNDKASYHYKRGTLIGPATPETLEFFLLERYVLFSVDKHGQLYKGLVHHEPYQMYAPEVTAWNDQPLIWNGLMPLESNPVHQIISKGVRVNIYSLTCI